MNNSMVKITFFDRIIIRIIARIWDLYTCDPRVLHRCIKRKDEPLFSVEHFITWLINYEYDEKVLKRKGGKK